MKFSTSTVHHHCEPFQADCCKSSDLKSIMDKAALWNCEVEGERGGGASALQDFRNCLDTFGIVKRLNKVPQGCEGLLLLVNAARGVAKNADGLFHQVSIRRLLIHLLHNLHKITTLLRVWRDVQWYLLRRSRM